MSHENTPLPPPLPAGADSAAETKPVSKVRWAIHLMIMAALPLAAGLSGAVKTDRGPALGHSVASLLWICGAEVLVFGVIFGLAWLASRATADDLLLRWRPGFWVLPLGMFYSIAIRIIAGVGVVAGVGIYIVSAHLPPAEVAQFAETHRPKVETLVDVQALSQDPAYYWLMVVIVSMVVGGLREEIWRSSFLAGLRSLWPRAFGSTGGSIAGAAVAALFFGAGHYPQGWLAVGAITIVGFLLGLIMVLHRSLWPSVIAHGLFDATSFVLLPWAMHHLPSLHPQG